MEKNGSHSHSKEELPVVIHISIFTKVYEYFKAKGKLSKYVEAIGMYAYLYQLARKQPNIRIWATIEYISRGTGLTRKKVISIKSDLVKIGLLEIHKEPNTKGKFGKTYIEVKFVWKPETLQKLFYQEQNETTQYKISKALLLEYFGEGYKFETEEMYDFELEMNGVDVVISSNLFYFDDNRLVCDGIVSAATEVDYFIVPTDRVNEIIREIASMYTYKTEVIYKALVYKIDE